MMCVFCGHTLTTWFELLKHQADCFPNSKGITNCEFCDTSYVFPTLDNIFYFVHCNSSHRPSVLKNWHHNCENCGMNFPKSEVLTQHKPMCFQGPDSIFRFDTNDEAFRELIVGQYGNNVQESEDTIEPSDMLETELTVKHEVIDEEDTELITGDI